MNYETFLQELHAARDRAGRFRLQAEGPEPAATILTDVLQELDVALEELRVTEEEVRTQHEAMEVGRRRNEAERARYQALFDLAPAAYLVTDPAGVVREANRWAVSLLGVDRRFLPGKPLVAFMDGEERWRLRDRLGRLTSESVAVWTARLRPRAGDPFPVAVSVAAARDAAGAVRELRWLLWPAPEADPPVTAPEAADPVGPAPAGSDGLTKPLHEVAEAAALLLRADGVGLMLADRAGSLRWVTATSEAEQAFERAQRDFDEGPCVDAFRSGQVVFCSDLRADPRWPRLAPTAAVNQVRGVLAAPVTLDGTVLGTCNAVSHRPRAWGQEDVAAVVAFATVLGRLLGSTVEAGRLRDLAGQLQTALDSRILVEQAKGVLMGREGLSAQAAFDRLRRLARSRSRRIDEVAREVIADQGPAGGAP